MPPPAARALRSGPAPLASRRSTITSSPGRPTGTFTVSYGSTSARPSPTRNGDNYTSLTLNTATITIAAGQSVPEPGTLGMGAVAIIVGFMARRRMVGRI